jgi:hypothetical protein
MFQAVVQKAANNKSLSDGLSKGHQTENVLQAIGYISH